MCVKAGLSSLHRKSSVMLQFLVSTAAVFTVVWKEKHDDKHISVYVPQPENVPPSKDTNS